MQLKEAAKVCPVCKKGKGGFLKAHKTAGKNFSLYFCNKCKVQFWEPRVSPGNLWYEVRNPSNIGAAVKPKIYRGYHTKALKGSQKWSKGVKVLDVGCGTGEFIAQLSNAGFDVFGVDFDKKSIEIAKKEFKLKNIFSESFEVFFDRNLPKFDVVTFFEVFEHLDDHAEFIKNIEKVLKPGGRIILSTPNRERFFVNANKWDFPPHHFTRWNLEALKNIFSEAGFQIDGFDYVENLKLIMGAIDGKTRSGLVQKSLGKQEKSNLLMAKALYFLAKLKFALAGAPACLLWVFGKLTKRGGGIIYIELTKKNA